MGGCDKYLIVEKLKAQGWIEDTEAGNYMLRPPIELLNKMRERVFYVYEALELQELVYASKGDTTHS